MRSVKVRTQLVSLQNHNIFLHIKSLKHESTHCHQQVYFFEMYAINLAKLFPSWWV